MIQIRSQNLCPGNNRPQDHSRQYRCTKYTSPVLGFQKYGHFLRGCYFIIPSRGYVACVTVCERVDGTQTTDLVFLRDSALNVTRRNTCCVPESVRALVRWATGKKLTNRLPKLSLTTLSPPLNSGILGLRMGPYVPTPKFFPISGDPGRVIHQILDMRKYAFL